MRHPPLPLLAVMLALAACADQPISGPADAPALSQSLAPGAVQTVLPLTAVTDMPEGIAVDQQGRLFVGNRRLVNGARVSEILEIAGDHSASVFVTLDAGTPDEFDGGVLGLALNPRGDLYAALATSNPATHGVWRIDRNGNAERLLGSEAMATPNALAFDRRGNLYVTDSEDGAIWRFPRRGPGALYLRHQLLVPDPNFGVGANGIVFLPPRNLYVANTDQGLIARIPIEPNGDPGAPEVVASGFELLTVDGLAADAHGNLFAVIAGAGIFGTTPLVHVDPRSGTITPATTEAGSFDFPTSLAFGTGVRDRKSVYVVNAGLFPEDRPEAAPGVVRVGVGVPGFPAH